MKALLSTLSLLVLVGSLAACSSPKARPAPAPGTAGAAAPTAPQAPAGGGAACGNGGKACG